MSFFGAAPDTYEACGVAWANAIGTYAASITPPSTTVTAAQAALGSDLGSAFGETSAIAGMESALATFAASVGAGMAGYVATPPPAPVGFLVAFSDPPPSTHDEAADELASLIDTWMRTGLATLATPPGTVIPWS